ncbi:MAG TPA: 3-methyl-2-oxobutanoate hydroxymethyltransferase [Candidatus Polarisedimenticolia bacterium]|jgi:3-methyl-2-oxobutanoate hydroxymethyltransferase|nr:3-methyl-2-oxobutanoate hydroxymethyltransferase [Candidatus Polarisedimenticolia bacterium]
MKNAADPSISPVTVPFVRSARASGRRLAMLTAYDFPTARLLDQAGIDILLVGDSVGNNVLGYDSTLPVTMEEMLHHVKAVVRGVRRALVVADMPYLSYQTGKRDAIRNAGRFLKEAGAAAVKIEGGRRRAALVRALVDAEIPVMGHIGLTPQSVHVMGGYKVQGKRLDEARALVEDAQALEEAGAFSLVLEGMPEMVGRKVTESTGIPTLGIGAGRFCDGQVLVFHDFAGLSQGQVSRFVRRYADLAGIVTEATRRYIEDVRSGAFPSEAETYSMPAALEKSR